MAEEKQESSGLLSQLQRFKKSSLKKTETTITTEDGKKLLETHDSCGNYKAEVTNRDAYGFVPDERMDMQVGEILPGLILGSQDVAAELEILERYKVTHILNIASYVKNYFPDRITYKNLNLLDVVSFHILPFFPEAFKFIEEGRKAGCVLVHCNAGRSRAATICIGYLMKTQGMSYTEAHAHVKEKRPSISPNNGFIHQLRYTFAELLEKEREGYA